MNIYTPRKWNVSINFQAPSTFSLFVLRITYYCFHIMRLAFLLLLVLTIMGQSFRSAVNHLCSLLTYIISFNLTCRPTIHSWDAPTLKTKTKHDSMQSYQRWRQRGQALTNLTIARNLWKLQSIPLSAVRW